MGTLAALAVLLLEVQGQAELKPAPVPEAAPSPGAAPAAPAATEKPRLFVAALLAQGVDPSEASGFTDAIAASLTDRGLFKVITTKDLESLLGAERQKQLLGVCERDPAACSQGAADAVTARFVLSGQLSRLGTAY